MPRDIPDIRAAREQTPIIADRWMPRPSTTRSVSDTAVNFSFDIASFTSPRLLRVSDFFAQGFFGGERASCQRHFA
jgi:hypothetical protein